MIMTVEQLRTFISTELSDAVLEAKLQALELSIRKYTNNNFQNRNVRYKADVDEHVISCEGTYFAEDDTVQITDSKLNDGLYTVAESTSEYITVKESFNEESDVLVTKVVYPSDVKMGVVNMMDWDLNNRSKVGIQSEAISRHSVTYFNMDGDNSTIGFPKSLIGFLQPYKRARF